MIAPNMSIRQYGALSRCRAVLLWLLVMNAVAVYLVVPAIFIFSDIGEGHGILLFLSDPTIAVFVLVYCLWKLVRSVGWGRLKSGEIFIGFILIPVTIIPFLGVTAYACYYSFTRRLIGQPVGGAPRHVNSRRCKCGRAMQPISTIQWSQAQRDQSAPRGFSGYELFFNCSSCGRRAQTHSALMTVNYAVGGIVTFLVFIVVKLNLIEKKSEPFSTRIFLGLVACVVGYSCYICLGKLFLGIEGRLRYPVIASGDSTEKESRSDHS